MAIVVTPDDIDAPGLDPARVAKMIARALAMARTIAPCLAQAPDGSDVALAAEAIIIGALRRWIANAASGGLKSESAGIFSVTYGTITGNYSSADKASLRELCGGAKAYALDTTPGSREEADQSCRQWAAGMSQTATIPASAMLGDRLPSRVGAR